MLQIIPRSKRQYAAEDTEYLASKFLAFCNLYCLHIFYNSVQPKYVSNTSYNLKKMLTDISLALYNLKMVYNHRGRTISLTPDDFFSRHTDFSPLLSSNALTWSFSLVILFVYALPLELQVAVTAEAIFYPIFHVDLQLFCRNRSDRFFANTQLWLSSCFQRRTVAFVVSWIPLTTDAALLKIFSLTPIIQVQMLSTIFSVLISVIKIRMLSKLFNVTPLLLPYPLQGLW